MALDRQQIEKRDFPIGRRGYEPDAVDDHLARIAEEVDLLRRQAAARSATPQRTSPASIAQAASEQVRAIVEAAETSAADIERAADEEAARIRDEAEADARQTRDEAVGQSREHVGRVRESTTLMLQRVDAMEGELTTLIDSLRTGANRLNADLSLLEQGMGELYDAAGRERPGGALPARGVAEPSAAAQPAIPSDDDDDGTAIAEPTGAPVAVAEEPVVVADEPVTAGGQRRAADVPEVEPVAQASSGGGGDTEGARLVALNMALNGTAREDTDRYLAENFDLGDRSALLDEVYATVEG
jgi:DivIVA domain-containing protein